MMTVLLVSIYICFVSLGIPDSLLGVAWPAIYVEFDLPLGRAGYISMTIAACTILSSLASAGMIRRFGTGRVTAFSIFLTVVGLLGFSFSGGGAWFFLMAIPLGFGAGAIDSGLNSFVALHYSASKINYLQCAYGVGVMLSPYLMSLALGTDQNWRRGYWMSGTIQILILAIALISLPLWKKVEQTLQSQEEEKTSLTTSQVLKLPAARYSCLAFFTCCAVELTFGGWSSTYFVKAKGVPADQAALVTMLFYLGMTFSRFLSGLLAKRYTSWQMIAFSSGVLPVALLLLMLPLGLPLSAFALFLCGCGVGPLFGCLTHLTPENVGRENARALIGLQLATSYGGIMIMPYLFGQLAQRISTELFPGFQMFFHGLFILSLLGLIRVLKREGRWKR